ncbi:MAG: 1-(5-phosphoribosyl)-5-[(5-phosphoribosylamino)methylideneamino]imidazole-4-carboxamide isomerase [Clostridia bacterium]|nr:1-(5-phosphoribosyl)-5-[(5-phosphoribosylamino)methylideneamino]imidazole-4-carboxamide isomerase [Clostridia bacterium]
MIIFPAIDLCGGQAVRLFKGDFAQKTVYSDDPVSVALDFAAKGASHIHLVDLDGAKTGVRKHFDLIKEIKARTGLFAEVGGGIRAREDIEAYLSAGIDRVILGTKAAQDPEFIAELPAEVRERIAVGVDIKDGCVAVKGWTETSKLDVFTFCETIGRLGVRTVICTDISKDGAMQGASHELYRDISGKYDLDIIASGGVSSIDDVRKLRAMDLYGAVIGKAYYVGAVDLAQAIEVSR